MHQLSEFVEATVTLLPQNQVRLLKASILSVFLPSLLSVSNVFLTCFKVSTEPLLCGAPQGKKSLLRAPRNDLAKSLLLPRAVGENKNKKQRHGARAGWSWLFLFF